MAADPDAIYEELTERRRLMSRRVEHMRDDVRSGTSRVRDRASRMTGDLEARVGERPVSSLLTAGGAGVALGLLAPAPGMPHVPRRTGGEGDGGGLKGALLGAASGGLSSASARVFEEIVDKLRGKDEAPEPTVDPRPAETGSTLAAS